jgi:hypothetical protein
MKLQPIFFLNKRIFKKMKMQPAGFSKLIDNECNK